MEVEQRLAMSCTQGDPLNSKSARTQKGRYAFQVVILGIKRDVVESNADVRKGVECLGASEIPAPPVSLVSKKRPRKLETQSDPQVPRPAFRFDTPAAREQPWLDHRGLEREG